MELSDNQVGFICTTVCIVTISVCTAICQYIFYKDSKGDK